MAESEDRLEQELQLLKAYAMSDAFYTSPDNRDANLWIQLYITKMEPTLQDEVQWDSNILKSTQCWGPYGTSKRSMLNGAVLR